MRVLDIRLYLLAFSVCVTANASGPNVYSGDATSSSPVEPTVYADVSQTAIDNAVSFDGMYALAGLGLSSQKYGATIKGNSGFTNNNIHLVSFIGGMGYSKAFKNDVLLGVEASIGLSRKKKKKGTIKEMNFAYHDILKQNTASGQLESCFATPSIDVKCGYQLKKYKILVFGKIGVSWMGGTYNYYDDNNIHGSV